MSNSRSEQTASIIKYVVEGDGGDGNEMPSVTRLLNRKKLGLKSAPATPPPTPTPVPVIPRFEPLALESNAPAPVPETSSSNGDGISISMELSTDSSFVLESSGPPPQAPPQASPQASTHAELELSVPEIVAQVVPITTKKAALKKPGPTLTSWRKEQFQTSSDPLQTAILKILDAGVQSLLYLNYKEPMKSGGFPTFQAS